jgi:hypothetical protein
MIEAQKKVKTREAKRRITKSLFQLGSQASIEKAVDFSGDSLCRKTMPGRTSSVEVICPLWWVDNSLLHRTKRSSTTSAGRYFWFDKKAP